MSDSWKTPSLSKGKNFSLDLKALLSVSHSRVLPPRNRCSHWPMHQIQVHVVDSQIFQCLVQRRLDIFRSMLGVP